MPKGLGEQREEERIFGRIPYQVSSQEDTASGMYAPRILIEVDSDGDPVYVGINDQSKSTSDTNWTIKKIFYDVNKNVIDVQVLKGSWDNRASLNWKSAGGN